MIRLKNNRFNYRCKEFNGTSTKSVNDLIGKFLSTYQFCNGDLNKFVLLFRKGVHPYECMDIWKKFDETSLPPKEDFYSESNLEGISDKDYNHAQKLWEVLEINNRGNYHGFYVQADIFLLADAFEKVRDKFIEICGLDSSYFYYASGLAWQACLKKTNAKLGLLTDYRCY